MACLAATPHPKGPSVIISFESKHGPLWYATDVFDHWHANLRALALGLEALRKVERYGITKRGEQYTGWRQLGSGIEMPAAQMTEMEALEFLRIHAGWSYGPDYDDHEDIERAYRQAAKTLHPDAGGSTADSQRLQEAKRLLDGVRS